MIFCVLNEIAQFAIQSFEFQVCRCVVSIKEIHGNMVSEQIVA